VDQRAMTGNEAVKNLKCESDSFVLQRDHELSSIMQKPFWTLAGKHGG